MKTGEWVESRKGEMLVMEKVQFECKGKELYLASTECIDYKHPLVQEKVAELRKTANSSLDYIQRAYEFVRDEIPHSWDIEATAVSRKTSDVLRSKTVKEIFTTS